MRPLPTSRLSNVKFNFRTATPSMLNGGSMRSARLAVASISILAVAISLAPTAASEAVPAAAAQVAFTDELPVVAAKGHPDAVEENYSVLFETLFHEAPGDWGGAYVDGDTLVVNTVRYTPDEATSILSQLGVTRAVTVKQVTESISDLKALRDSIVAAALPGVTSVGPQYASSKVVVGLAKPDSDVLETLYKIGGDRVQAYSNAAAALTGTRYFDLTPYHGGARIGLSNSSGAAFWCSSGFAWNAPGGGSTKYMITASHCTKTPNATVLTVNRISTTTSWVPIGTIQWSSGGNSGTTLPLHGDTAAYSISYESNIGKVYDGAYDTSNLRLVTGQQSLAEGWTGSNLYSSGAGPALGNGDGQVQMDWVSLVDQTITYNNGQTFYDLSVGENSWDCFGGGDSGGAVYLRSGTSNAIAVGIVSGTNNQGIGTTNCRNYYTPIGFVQWDWGGSLKLAP